MIVFIKNEIKETRGIFSSLQSTLKKINTDYSIPEATKTLTKNYLFRQ